MKSLEIKGRVRFSVKMQTKRSEVAHLCFGNLAAAAAKSLQLCPTLCDPIDGSPPGSPIPAILQARTLKQVAISFSNAWKWKSLGFSRQEYWSGVPLPFPWWFGIWDKNHSWNKRGNFVQIKVTSHRKDRILNNLNASFITDIVKKVKWIVGKYCGRFYNVFHILLQTG